MLSSLSSNHRFRGKQRKLKEINNKFNVAAALFAWGEREEGNGEG